MKKHLPTILIVIVFLVGLSILLYPTVSNWYNLKANSYTVSNYTDVIDNTSEEKFDEILEDARAYNEELHSTTQNFISGEAYDQTYIDTLNILNGMMGYLVIDKIDIFLPIYHGTDESVLQKAIGHLEGSSLPTGDIGNNTVLTGHTGLPSAELFTDLTQMEIGDTFELNILDEVYTYEVFNIVVVEPYEVDNLEAIEGKDVVTLVTCTPYGVNSHRLLVQGEQIEVVINDEIIDLSEEIVKDNYIYEYLPFIAMLIIAILIIILVRFRLRSVIYKHKKD